MEFEPVGGAASTIVLRVKDAPPNRAEVGLGYSEWEKARGSMRLRNQNTLGFGEQVELLLAASDAERVVEASLRGQRLLVLGLGYRVTGYTYLDKPRFFEADGHEINRAQFERNGVDVALALVASSAGGSSRRARASAVSRRRRRQDGDRCSRRRATRSGASSAAW